MRHLMRLLLSALFAPLLASGAAAAGAPVDMPMHPDAAHHAAMLSMSASTPLTAAGNGAFGAIQEAVRALQADPNTDWSKVNLEALREHLVDMRNMTLDVTVRSQKPIPGGVEIEVSGNGPAAEASLGGVLADHPTQLAMESGWTMKVLRRGSIYDLVVTTPRTKDVAEIRGLGYIGLLAIGNHHQVHHWKMATGKYPESTVPAQTPHR